MQIASDVHLQQRFIQWNFNGTSNHWIESNGLQCGANFGRDQTRFQKFASVSLYLKVNQTIS